MSGLDFGILSTAKVYTTNNKSNEKDLYDNINKFDLAAIFGAWAKIKVSKKFNVLFELRYSQSIMNQNNNNSGAAFEDIPARFRTAGFQFLTYLSFNL